MPASHADLRLKRAYDAPAADDGERVLVDRLWPRGLTKDELHLTVWLHDLAPSNELRKWFHAHPDHWAEFRRKYLSELRSPSATQALDELDRLARNSQAVTLLFASKQLERNNATVLKEFLEEEWKRHRKAPGKKRERRSASK